MRQEKTPTGSKRVKIVLAEEVVFLNKARIKKELYSLPNGVQLVIDMTKSLTIDYDVLEVIDDFKERAKTKDIQVTLITRDDGKIVTSADKQREMENAEVQS